MNNVKVEKQPNENSTSVIRRFTKRVQQSGVLHRAKNLRYAQRDTSKQMKKRQTLKSLRRKEEREELIKLGKLPERPHRS
jgi:ribosomal protein S21